MRGFSSEVLEMIQGHCHYFKTSKNNIRHTKKEKNLTWLNRRFCCFFPCFSTPRAHCRLFSVFQVRWHGAKNNRGEGVWVHMFSEWGAGHRLTRPCDSVKLQPHLPPKSASGETTSPEGTDDPPPSVFLLLLCFLSIALCFAFICLFLLSFTYPHVTGWQGKHYLLEC